MESNRELNNPKRRMSMGNTGILLRADQEKAKAEIYAALRSGASRVAFQAMTSFGKTVLAASIVHDALSRQVGVLFVAPMITLVDQTLEEFRRFGIRDVGVIQADHPMTDYGQPVQVCSVQSIASISKRTPAQWREYQRGKLVIVDECHIWHRTHEYLVKCADKPVIGLSATPWRKGLGNHFDVLVNGPSTSWLIENGHLSPYRAYSHYQPDMTGVSTGANGDYSLRESGEKYEPKIIGNIVQTWRRYASGRKTILFAPRVADAERFAVEFSAQGVSAVAVSGYMDREDCRVEVEKFRRGQTTVIASVAKLATGFSVRDVGCIIDAQPTKSLMRHIQKLGRGLRTHPDKEDVIILDNAGNLLRNGLPDDEYPQKLCDGNESADRKPAEQALPEPCPSCQYVKPAKTRKCPSCGFEPARQSVVEVEEGDLVELGKAQRKRNRQHTAAEKEQFFRELRAYSVAKGYSSGWEKHKYRERYGVWPNRFDDEAWPAEEISKETRDWILSRQIAFAKGQYRASA